MFVPPGVVPLDLPGSVTGVLFLRARGSRRI
jgi:hypothetical protein